MQLTSLTTRFDADWSKLAAIDSPDTLLLAFGPPDPAGWNRTLDCVRALCPTSVVLGCSTPGAIHGDRILDDACSLAALRFDHTRLNRASATVDAPGDSRAAGERIAAQLLEPDLRSVLVFTAGPTIRASAVLRGLTDGLPAEVTVVGGLAQGWTIDDGGPRTDSVVAVGLCGDRASLDHSRASGWRAFGPDRLVTRSFENTIYELDGKPILDLYDSYLHSDRVASHAALLPIMQSGRASPEPRIRTPLTIHRDERSVTFDGDVAKGTRVQLMHADFDQMIRAATIAARHTERRHGDTLALVIGSIGSQIALAERCEEEVEATLREFPDHTRQVGFYGVGDIDRDAAGDLDLHCQSVSVVAITES